MTHNPLKKNCWNPRFGALVDGFSPSPRDLHHLWRLTFCTARGIPTPSFPDYSSIHQRLSNAVQVISPFGQKRTLLALEKNRFTTEWWRPPPSLVVVQMSFSQNFQVCQSDIFAWRITHFQTDLPEASGSTELVAFDHISILAMAGSEKYFLRILPIGCKFLPIDVPPGVPDPHRDLRFSASKVKDTKKARHLALVYTKFTPQ